MSEQANNKLTDEHVTTFTKEQLKEHLDMRLTHTRNAAQENAGTGWAEFYEKEVAVLEIALASLEAKPVAFINGSREPVLYGEHIVIAIASQLYTAPPAPVSVPGELTREEYKRRFMEEDEFDDTFRGGWSACRAAMQGKAKPGNLPVIPDGWIKCSERLPGEFGRYWCYVEEQNSLGKSHYQWNCSWNGNDWSDQGLSGRVTHWMPLAAAPQPVEGTIEMLAKVLANAPLWPIDNQGKKRSI